MPRIAPIARRFVRPVGALVIATGLLCCVLPRSRAEGAAPSPAVVDGPVLHNDTDADRVVRIRPLSVAVDLDCDAIAEHPGQRLPAALFGSPVASTVPPDGDLALVRDGDRPCRAAWIEGDGLPPTIAFWRDGTEQSEVRLVPHGDALRLDGPAEILHAPVEAEPTRTACASADDGERLAWSAPVPTGVRVLERIDVGLDGCLALSLADDATWYLCAPADAFPFAVGDAIEIEPVYDTGVEGVRLSDATRELVVARGSAAPAVLDLQWTTAPVHDCAFASAPACGTVGRAAELHVASAAFGAGTVRADGPALELQAADGRRVRIEPAVVQERVALDPECAFGPDVLGPDIELAVTIVRG